MHNEKEQSVMFSAGWGLNLDGVVQKSLSEEIAFTLRPEG